MEGELGPLPNGAGMSLLAYSMLSQHGQHLESFSHTITSRPSHKTKKLIEADVSNWMAPTAVDRSNEIPSTRLTMLTAGRTHQFLEPATPYQPTKYKVRTLGY